MSKDKFKSFGLSTWAVNNRKTIFLITFVILIGGMMSYFSMPKENFPEIQIPEILIAGIHHSLLDRTAVCPLIR